MSTSACRLCLNTQDNKTHLAREMMLGTKDEFTYLECSACGCTQLLDPPNSMERYYPSDYYSFSPEEDSLASTLGPKSLLRRLRNRVYLADCPVVTSVLDKVAPYGEFRLFAAMKPNRKSRILDVGCGAGHLLRDIVSVGFKHALGIDPFAQGNIKYRSGLEVRKCALDDLSGTTWDLIMFHHSFEHIPDPLAALRTVTTLLSEGGYCLIAIPVASWAWQNYGVDWVELDAPRHFFLHTERSLGLLAERVGLRVTRIEYNSDGHQFWGSELNRRGIHIPTVLKQPGGLRQFFSAGELRRFEERARRLNEGGQGGRAVFYLAKS